MPHRLPRRFVLPLLGAALVGVKSLPATACIVGWPFKAGKPFNDAYFDWGHTVFRGEPVQYRLLRYAAEITFAVKATYRGEHRDSWKAIWRNSTFGHPDDLADFRRQIGDDLVTVLRDFVATEVRGQVTYIHPYLGDDSDAQSPLPLVVQGGCHEPAMQTFEVMEPVLRQRGLID